MLQNDYTCRAHASLGTLQAKKKEKHQLLTTFTV